MMIRRLIYIFALILTTVSTAVQAQEFEVTVFEPAPDGESAKFAVRGDVQGNPRALIRVACRLADLTFTGSVVGNVEKRGEEYLLYVPHDAKIVCIKHPNLKPLYFSYPCKLESGAVYHAELSLPEKLYQAITGETAGTRTDVDYEKMPLQEMLHLADDGDPRAMYSLGLCYSKGTGVTRDDGKAVYWYRKGAIYGNVKAQAALALALYTGTGVAPNPYLAVEWFRAAAEQGDAEAQYYIGLCYKNGEGVTAVPEEARWWFRTAADQGYGRAAEELR